MKLNTPWYADDMFVIDSTGFYIGLINQMGGIEIVNEIIKRVNATKDE